VRAVIGGWVEREPIRGRLVISEVEMVLVAPSRKRDIQRLSTLGSGDHGVRHVHGGPLGAMDRARVPELHMASHVLRRQHELAAVALPAR
jgi:hypothetical protein